MNVRIPFDTKFLYIEKKKSNAFYHLPILMVYCRVNTLNGEESINGEIK